MKYTNKQSHQPILAGSSHLISRCGWSRLASAVDLSHHAEQSCSLTNATELDAESLHLDEDVLKIELEICIK